MKEFRSTIDNNQWQHWLEFARGERKKRLISSGMKSPQSSSKKMQNENLSAKMPSNSNGADSNAAGTVATAPTLSLPEQPLPNTETVSRTDRNSPSQALDHVKADNGGHQDLLPPLPTSPFPDNDGASSPKLRFPITEEQPANKSAAANNIREMRKQLLEDLPTASTKPQLQQPQPTVSYAEQPTIVEAASYDQSSVARRDSPDDFSTIATIATNVSASSPVNGEDPVSPTNVTVIPPFNPNPQPYMTDRSFVSVQPPKVVFQAPAQMHPPQPPTHLPRQQMLASPESMNNMIRGPESPKFPSRKPVPGTQLAVVQRMAQNYPAPSMYNNTIAVEEDDEEEDLDESVYSANQSNFGGGFSYSMDGMDNMSERTVRGTVSASESISSIPSTVVMPTMSMENIPQVRQRNPQASAALSIPSPQTLPSAISQPTPAPLISDPYEAYMSQNLDPYGEEDDNNTRGAEESKQAMMMSKAHSLVNEDASIQMLAQMLANNRSFPLRSAPPPSNAPMVTNNNSLYPSQTFVQPMINPRRNAQDSYSHGLPSSYQPQMTSNLMPPTPPIRQQLPPSAMNHPTQSQDMRRQHQQMPYPEQKVAPYSNPPRMDYPNYPGAFSQTVDDNYSLQPTPQQPRDRPTDRSFSSIQQSNVEISVPRRREERPPAPSMANPLMPTSSVTSPSNASLPTSRPGGDSPNSAFQHTVQVQNIMERRLPSTTLDIPKPSADGVSLQKRQLGGRSKSAPRPQRHDGMDAANPAAPPYIMAPVLQANQTQPIRGSSPPRTTSVGLAPTISPWVSPMVKPLRSGSPTSPKRDEKVVPSHHQPQPIPNGSLSRQYPEWSAVPSAVEAVATVHQYQQQANQSQRILSSSAELPAQVTLPKPQEGISRSTRDVADVAKVGSMRLDAVYSAAKYLLSALEGEDSKVASTDFAGPK